jgi:hypothetical protein
MITKVEVIVVLPGETPLANPALSIVATAVDDELHATKAVRFSVLPPLKWPVAVNCCAVPTAIEGFAGVTVMEMSPLSDTRHPPPHGQRTDHITSATKWQHKHREQAIMRCH